MKRNLLILFLSGVHSLLFGQLDSFNLAAYRLPDIKTHRLDFNVWGDGSTQWSRTNSTTGTISSLDSYRFNGTISGGYSMQRNKESYQGEQFAVLACHPNFSRDDYGKSQSLSTVLSAGSMNRSYFSRGQFMQYGLSLSGNLNQGTGPTPAGEKYTSGSSSLRIEMPVLFGFGRIEPVQDARLAVYILQDLQKAGRISRMPDQAEILEFAGMISQTKSKRIFDSRDKLIWEIGTVDAWLQSVKLISSGDAAYFTRLYDNWLYSTGPVRESGRRISMGLIGNYYSYSYHGQLVTDTAELINQEGRSSIKAVFRVERANPLSLYWQTGSLYELAGFYDQERPERILGNTIIDRSAGLSGKVKYSYGWYPGSRSNINLSISLTGDLFKDFPQVEKDNQWSFDVYPAAGLTFNYYFSQQLRFYLFYHGGYSLTGERWDTLYAVSTMHSGTRGFNQSFRLNVTYSLF